MGILYEGDVAGHSLESICKRRLTGEGCGTAVQDFVRSLISDITERIDEIDTFIRKAAPVWPIEQVSIVDRNIDNGLEVILESLRKLDDGKYKTVKQNENKVIKISGKPNLEQLNIGYENLENIIREL